MKGYIATKTVKELKFEGVWGKLEAKKFFPEIIMEKIFETKSVMFL